MNTTDVLDIIITGHARMRMDARGIGACAVAAALRHGRVAHVRGAAIHAIGRREVRALERRGVNVRAFEGVHVVCTPDDATVLTVYRNRSLRPLRTGRHNGRA